MCQVLVDIPNEVLYDTHMSTSDASAFVKQMVALGYYTHNNVSIGYCAKIADMTEEEYDDIEFWREYWQDLKYDAKREEQLFGG